MNTVLTLDAIEIFSGYMNADLKSQYNYEVIPLFLSFDFEAKPVFSKIGFKPKGELNFVIEPFVNTVF